MPLTVNVKSTVSSLVTIVDVEVFPMYRGDDNARLISRALDSDNDGEDYVTFANMASLEKPFPVVVSDPKHRRRRPKFTKTNWKPRPGDEEYWEAKWRQELDVGTLSHNDSRSRTHQLHNDPVNMSPDSLRAFFEQREAAKHTVVHGAPRFDLEGYLSNYSGRTRVDRLIHIGTHSVPLAIEALKLVIKLLKQGTDVVRYKFAVSVLQKISPHDPDARLDEDWADRTARKVQIETEKMEAALKSYKHNLIKESIRMGHEDLGNHFYASGDLTNAFKCYSRMRDFCTAPKHVLDMSLQIIRVCIEQGNMLSVQTHVSKIRNLHKTSEDEEEALKPKLAAAMGLAHLSAGHYLSAARCFLECPPTLGSTFNDVMSSNDVAIYGGLCALASMDRQALKSEVLDNNHFRGFLELEPHMRRAIHYFYSAKYSNCLQILEEYKNDYLLDIHLYHHVRSLYDSIRSKSIVQYFIPFSCVTLSSMAEAFATNEARLESELVGMIQSGILDARIDTQNRLLVAKETDLRASVHKNVLDMASNYERSARQKLTRINMARSGLEVRGPKGPSTTLMGGTGSHAGAGMQFQDTRGASSRAQGFLERFS